MTFKNVYPLYTGGGFYEFYIWAKEGYFITCNEYYEFTKLTANPFNDIERACETEWVEEHTNGEDLEEEKPGTLYMKMLKWIIKNEPDGNYLITDMERELDIAKEEVK